MSKAFEEIAREATQLSQKQRLDLASLLLEMNDETSEDVSATWEEEILARIQAVDSGQTLGFSFEDVIRDAESRLSS
jgi:hypothetical protein